MLTLVKSEFKPEDLYSIGIGETGYIFCIDLQKKSVKKYDARQFMQYNEEEDEEYLVIPEHIIELPMEEELFMRQDISKDCSDSSEFYERVKMMRIECMTHWLHDQGFDIQYTGIE